MCDWFSRLAALPVSRKKDRYPFIHYFYLLFFQAFATSEEGCNFFLPSSYAVRSGSAQSALINASFVLWFPPNRGFLGFRTIPRKKKKREKISNNCHRFRAFHAAPMMCPNQHLRSIVICCCGVWLSSDRVKNKLKSSGSRKEEHKLTSWLSECLTTDFCSKKFTTTTPSRWWNARFRRRLRRRRGWWRVPRATSRHLADCPCRRITVDSSSTWTRLRLARRWTATETSCPLRRTSSSLPRCVKRTGKKQKQLNEKKKYLRLIKEPYWLFKHLFEKPNERDSCTSTNTWIPLDYTVCLYLLRIMDYYYYYINCYL